MSRVRFHEKLAGSPHETQEPIGRRHRPQSDYALRELPRNMSRRAPVETNARAWRIACKTAGIRYKLHDMRHKFISRVESGAETKLSGKQEAQASAVARGLLQMRFRWRFAYCFLLGVFGEAVFGNTFLYIRP